MIYVLVKMMIMYCLCHCMLVARSSLLDRSFDLCDFQDDPEPLRDKIRSRRMKILLRKSHELLLRLRRKYWT